MAKKTHEQQAHPGDVAAALVAQAISQQASGGEGRETRASASSVTTSRAKEEVIELVLERLSDGDTLTAICASLPMARLTWYRWMDADPRLRARYEEAIRIGTDVLGDLAHGVAAGTTAAGDMTAVAAIKLQLDAIKWVAAVRNPARYSERHTAHVTGQMAQDQTPAVPLRIDLAALSMDDLRTLEAINERALAPAEETDEA